MVYLIHASSSVSWQILKFYAFSKSCSTTEQVLTAFPLFSKCGSKLEVYCLSLSCRFMLAFCACSLLTYQNLLSMSPLGTFIGICPQKRRTCWRGMQNFWDAHELVGLIHCWASTVAYWQASWWSLLCNYSDLHPFAVLWEGWLLLSQWFSTP